MAQVSNKDKKGSQVGETEKTDNQKAGCQRAYVFVSKFKLEVLIGHADLQHSGLRALGSSSQ